MSGLLKKIKNDKNNKLGILIFAIPRTMFLFVYASVPLYNLFCNICHGGTIQEVLKPSEDILFLKNQ